MDSRITPNTSNQQLVSNNGDNESATALIDRKHSSRSRENFSDVSFKEYIMVAILCFVNLINYMDRFTIAGVLKNVQDEFGVQDDMGGLLQTVFVVFYMIFAPAFGYLGDRYSRRYLMAGGIALWSLTTFVGSFMKNFYWFMLFRALVGIGEASYSTIAPTIISDLFVGNLRSKMLSVFYFAIPVGSGLGYIVGSKTAELAADWRYALRVTPLLGVIATVLVLFIMYEPRRGEAEHSNIQPTSYTQDLVALIKNPSFMLSTLGFTCVAFVTGALAWWGPKFLALGLKIQSGDQDINTSTVSYKFGIVSMIAGCLGVPTGIIVSRRLRLITGGVGTDPQVCGLALLAATPLLFTGMVMANYSFNITLTVVFIAQLFINLTWAIVADMLLYVVVPPRRSTAEAFQILISHMFGDAGSPYIIGLISETLKKHYVNDKTISSDLSDFMSLQNSLFLTCFVEIIGGGLFLFTAFYVAKDKEKVDKAIAEADRQVAEPVHTEAGQA